MSTAVQILFWLSVVGWGVVLNYCGRYDKVITWAISLVVPRDLTKQEAGVYRAALSPSQYLRIINLQFGLPILVLAIGSYLKWYLGIVGLLVSVMLVWNVLSRVMPGTVQGYLLQIILGLEHKAANYKKQGDSVRAEAAEDYLVPLKEVYELIREKRYNIPASGSIDINLDFHRWSHQKALEMVEAMNEYNED